MPFANENVSHGISDSNPFQAGLSDFDNNVNLEDGALVPWLESSAGSYLYYDCAIEVHLDSGLVTHTPLPQVDRTYDTLGAAAIDANQLDGVTNKGVILKSNDQFQDIVQRMAHSRYWFHLSGQAIRVGYRVPIPALKTVGGVLAVPHDANPQRAFNRIMPGGNYSGVILWHAEWSLWYTVIKPPTSDYIPEVDLAAHITGKTALPAGMQAPFSRADDDAQPNQPTLQGFFTQG